MAVAEIRGARINYEVFGGGEQWVVLTPGGRRSLDGVRVLGERIAAAGFSVLLHDRRNCGASDVVIEGDESEQEIWAHDLYELLQRLDALPVVAGGGSAGCRLSLLLTLRHPDAVRALLLWWVTGGPVAAARLGYNYYGRFIEGAESGGMAAVCASEFFAERIAENPSNRERLMAMNPARFIAVMASWQEFFTRGAELPVIGATEDQLRSIAVPSCIVPGDDALHPFAVGENLHSLLGDSELHDVRSDVPTVAPDDLGPAELAELQVRRQEEIGEIFVDFLQRTVTPTVAAR